MKKHFRCFKSAVNIGLSYSRVDVLGIRDVGGDLSGDVETIAIEVKRRHEPFATSSGQASGYRVYANRIYLAECREREFRPDEIEIASHLGIGLIHIKAGRCKEVLSSPHYTPITRMSLQLIEKLALGRCQLCGTFFEIGSGKDHRFSKVSREDFAKAYNENKGIIFWNRELSERKNRTGVRKTDGTTFERRFLCPDCVSRVLVELTNLEDAS